MFFGFGYQHAIKTLFKVSVSLPGKYDAIKSLEDLKSAYLDFLALKQPEVTPNKGCQLVFSSPHDISEAKAAFGLSGLNDLSQEHIIGGPLDKGVQEQYQASIEKSYQLIEAANPELYNVLNIVINKITFANSNSTVIGDGAYAGSSSNALGLLWLSGKPGLRTHEFMELLIHELTHNLVFIDELVNPQFDYETIADPKAFCQSAVLGLSRPIDKVVHSIAVATEIILGRYSLGLGTEASKVHPDSSKLAESALESVYSIENNEFVGITAQPRVFEIIRHYKSTLLSLQERLAA